MKCGAAVARAKKGEMAKMAVQVQWSLLVQNDMVKTVYVHTWNVHVQSLKKGQPCSWDIVSVRVKRGDKVKRAVQIQQSLLVQNSTVKVAYEDTWNVGVQSLKAV